MGVVPFAALYDGQYQPAIASSVFTVIRIMDSVAIMPAYLQWYLNHPATIQTLIAASRGTSIPLITRDVIEGLLVPVPPIKKQERIIRLQRLQQQAIRLRMRINELNESLFQNRLLEIANGE
jgi:restriction endonuclease S subunit